jgi:hypothetical protein
VSAAWRPAGKAGLMFGGWLAHRKGCAVCIGTAHGCAWGSMLLRCAALWAALEERGEDHTGLFVGEISS